MFETIKTLLFLAKNYNTLIEAEHHYAMHRINSTNRALEDMQKVIQEQTTINLDYYPTSDNYIIVMGHYKEREYIETFNVGSKNMNDIIDFIRELQQYGHLRIVDGPPVFKAVLDKSLERQKSGD